jgi:hypothetical protein
MANDKSYQVLCTTKVLISKKLSPAFRDAPQEFLMDVLSLRYCQLGNDLERNVVQFVILLVFG